MALEPNKVLSLIAILCLNISYGSNINNLLPDK